MKLIDGHALADRLLADAITLDQIRQAKLIQRVIDEMPEEQFTYCMTDTLYPRSMYQKSDVPRVLAHWIKLNSEKYGLYLACAGCGKFYIESSEIIDLLLNSNFCPNCGADMREGEPK